jgi:hypothetical protein
MNILAGIYDESEKIYIAVPYEMKRVACHNDILGRTIASMEEIVLLFFVVEGRVIGGRSMKSVGNVNSNQMSSRKLSLVIRF